MTRIIVLLMASAALLLSGCNTPSELTIKTITYYKADKVVDRVEKTETWKYEFSYFRSYKVLGFELKPYDPVTKTFSLKALYGHMESGTIHKGQTYHSDFSLDNVSLFTASGSAAQSFYVSDKENETGYFKYLSKKPLYGPRNE